MKDGTLLLSGAINPWPVRANQVLGTKSIGGFTVEVVATTDGHIEAVFSPESGGTTTKNSCRIAVSGMGPVQIGLSWSEWGSVARFYLNGRPVQEDPDGTPFTLVLPGALPVPQGRMYAHIDPSRIIDDAERIFLQTVVDIDELATKGDEYSLITASGRVRLLVSDEQPLCHRVNRKYRRQLRFGVMEWPSLDPAAFGEMRPLDPALVAQFPGAVVKNLPLDKLLSRPVLSFNGVTATVLDVLKACANAKGGVHFGSGKDEAETATLAWDTAVRLLGVAPSLVVIAQICRVVLRGLGPLVNALQGHNAR